MISRGGLFVHVKEEIYFLLGVRFRDRYPRVMAKILGRVKREKRVLYFSIFHHLIFLLDVLLHPPKEFEQIDEGV